MGTDPIIHLLQRLVDSDGTLKRYQINAETDAQTIIDAERDEFVQRNLRPMAMRQEKLISVTITERGRAKLKEIEDANQPRLPYPLDGDCFVGMDVPLPGTWGPEDVAFWTATPHYQPWKDVAAFFRAREPS